MRGPSFLGLLVAIALGAGHSCGESAPRTIHAFVALCDNEHQGIVPVRPELGNGDDAAHNLYWGARYGVKTFFRESDDWEALSSNNTPGEPIVERCIFRHRTLRVYLIADAFRGRAIKQSIVDFLNAAAGLQPQEVPVPGQPSVKALRGGGVADLIVYVGHDGLMDFTLDEIPQRASSSGRDAIVPACRSKSFFAEPLRAAGARPLLWSTGLMAPEAYTLKAALDGWVLGEPAEAIRERAAQAYHKYQKCGLTAARRLLATGW
jgi:hypothetical protein